MEKENPGESPQPDDMRPDDSRQQDPEEGRDPEWTGGQELVDPAEEGADAAEAPDLEEDEESQVELDSSE